MRAWIISDTHLTPAELARPDRIDIPDADICICAGDLSGSVDMSMAFLARHIAPRMPVVLTLGNHDCYGSSISRALESARQQAADGVDVLENEVRFLGGVRILGATLWTDFECNHGLDKELPLHDRKSLALRICQRYMLDFHAIFQSDGFEDGIPGMLTTTEWMKRHFESRAFIESELAKPFTGKSVVLTHHAPLEKSLHPHFRGHPSNAAFASDLSSLIRRWKPDIWIHGHVHHAFDYREGHTRVICNPLGYQREKPETGFIQGLVVDL